MFLFEAGGTLQGVAGTATAITVTVTGVSVDTTLGAETFGLLYQGQLPLAAGVLFTVPAGKAWIVKTISVTNPTGSSVAGVQLFQNGAAAANSLLGPMTLGSFFTATASENGWSVVDASGNIQTSGGGGGGGGITQLTGDVTAGPGTGSQLATIAAAAVTYAKMQHVSANSKLLGSGAAGGGSSPAELTLGTGLTMTGTTLNAATGGSLLNIQILTTLGAGTYTPTAGTNSIIIQLVGGGGGGAGCGTASGSQLVLGGSGGGGGFCQKRLTANFSGAGFVVGAGGTAGASGNNAGGTGTATTFTTTGGSPVTYTAGGGVGGVAGGSFAAPLASGVSAGGAATNGDLNIKGGGSGYGFAGNTFSVIVGCGGSSVFAGATTPNNVANASNSPGIAGQNYGGGATGAGSSNGGAAAAGAAGGQGVIIVYEYS